MTEVDVFINEFLQHALREERTYDPVKAHEYYMRTRELKGRKKKNQSFGDRLKAARDKLKHLPDGKKDAVEKKLNSIEKKFKEVADNITGDRDEKVSDKRRQDVSKADLRAKRLERQDRNSEKADKVDPRSQRMYSGKPLKKLGAHTRMEEDEAPEVSTHGAKLLDYDGSGNGKATYADGRTYDPKHGWQGDGNIYKSPSEWAKKNLKEAKQKEERIGVMLDRVLAQKKKAHSYDLPKQYKLERLRSKLLRQYNRAIEIARAAEKEYEVTHKKSGSSR